ncbi:hypothetical protein JXR93_01830 [bacterium]|nr:hypothetical protein [bacterium]
MKKILFFLLLITTTSLFGDAVTTGQNSLHCTDLITKVQCDLELGFRPLPFNDDAFDMTKVYRADDSDEMKWTKYLGNENNDNTLLAKSTMCNIMHTYLPTRADIINSVKKTTEYYTIISDQSFNSNPPLTEKLLNFKVRKSQYGNNNYNVNYNIVGINRTNSCETYSSCRGNITTVNFRNVGTGLYNNYNIHDIFRPNLSNGWEYLMYIADDFGYNAEPNTQSVFYKVTNFGYCGSYNDKHQCGVRNTNSCMSDYPKITFRFEVSVNPCLGKEGNESGGICGDSVNSCSYNQAGSSYSCNCAAGYEKGFDDNGNETCKIKTCYNDTDCGTTEEYCNNGYCDSLCTTNSDCSSNQICNSSNGKCTTIQCTTDSDCDNRDYCDTSVVGGICKFGECRSNSDCGDNGDCVNYSCVCDQGYVFEPNDTKSCIKSHNHNHGTIDLTDLIYSQNVTNAYPQLDEDIWYGRYSVLDISKFDNGFYALIKYQDEQNTVKPKLILKVLDGQDGTFELVNVYVAPSYSMKLTYYKNSQKEGFYIIYPYSYVYFYELSSNSLTYKNRRQIPYTTSETFNSIDYKNGYLWFARYNNSEIKGYKINITSLFLPNMELTPSYTIELPENVSNGIRDIVVEGNPELDSRLTFYIAVESKNEDTRAYVYKGVLSKKDLNEDSIFTSDELKWESFRTPHKGIDQVTISNLSSMMFYGKQLYASSYMSNATYHYDCDLDKRWYWICSGFKSNEIWNISTLRTGEKIFDGGKIKIRTEVDSNRNLINALVTIFAQNKKGEFYYTTGKLSVSNNPDEMEIALQNPVNDYSYGLIPNTNNVLKVAPEDIKGILLTNLSSSIEWEVENVEIIAANTSLNITNVFAWRLYSILPTLLTLPTLHTELSPSENIFISIDKVNNKSDYSKNLFLGISNAWSSIENEYWDWGDTTPCYDCYNMTIDSWGIYSGNYIILNPVCDELTPINYLNGEFGLYLPIIDPYCE